MPAHFGGSKLVAEKFHQVWQAKDQCSLLIIRPGAVFGPGGGALLIKAVLGRYFFYMGNEDTRKAGTYVKDLCNVMMWGFDHQGKHNEHVSSFDMCMNPGPSIEEYVDTICEVAGHKGVVSAVLYKL